jgi:hypothetical protein
MRNGGVVQSGLDPSTRGNQADPMQPKLGLYRGVVLRTVTPRLADGSPNPESFRQFQVECDVILISSQVFLRQVPVLQRAYGVNNAAPWIPKATTRTLSGNRALNFNVRSARGQFVGPVPAFDDLDGDMVLVEFVEGHLDYPVITGALTHERSNRELREGTGWSEGTAAAKRGTPESEEHYLHHKGAEVRINDDGEVLIDTVGAYTDETTENASTAKGDVRVRVKDTQKLTIAMGNDEDVLEVWKDGSQLRVDLGEGAAERLVLGDGFRAFLNSFLSTEFALHQHLPGTFTNGGGAVTGQSGAVAPVDIPPTVPPPAFTSIQMGDDVLSDLAKTKKT